MALGIGAATVLFGVTYGVLMKPLAWPHADRLVVLEETRGGKPPRFGSFTNAAYLAWRDEATTLETLAAWSRRNVTLTGHGDPERIRITEATASLFPVLGARPLIGSLFEEKDEVSKDGAVIVVSESLWRQRFGADAAVLGRVVRLDGQPHRIIGVLPDALAYPDRQARAWIPLQIMPTSGNSLSIFDALGKLRPRATAAQAASEGTARARFVADTGPTTMAIFGGGGPVGITAVPLRDALASEVRRPLVMLLVAAGLLLVTATANVASLQLARATARRRELAIRAALGAGTGRVIRQLLVESLLLGAGGGGGGLALAWLLHRLVPSVLPADFPRAGDLRIDAAVVLFALIVSVLTSIVFGVLPALRVRRLNLVESLAENGTAPVGTGGRSRTARARMLIIAGQVAIACVLLVGASLLGRSFIALINVDRGYDPSGLLTARLSLPAAMYTPERRYLLLGHMLARLEAMPAVTDAAFTSELPLTPGGSTGAFPMRSRQAGGATVWVQASPRIVSPRCFSALGIRIAHGRGFDESDTQSALPVAIVNRAFSRRYLGDGGLGAKVPMGAGYGDESIEATVIGIAEDVRYPTAAQSTQPEIYYSFRQMKGRLAVPVVTLVVRARDDPRAITSVLRGVVRGADANLVADAVLPLQDRIATSVARPRLYAVLLGGFAAFALAVAAVGLFGVLSYSVAQRSRELGVRAALGATPSAIVRMVVADGLVVAGAGVVAGLAAALLFVRSLGTLLYGIAPYDAVTFAAVPLLLLVVAAVACFVPARRAARVDPLKVLKGG
jgi:predicted permease